MILHTSGAALCPLRGQGRKFIFCQERAQVHGNVRVASNGHLEHGKPDFCDFGCHTKIPHIEIPYRDLLQGFSIEIYCWDSLYVISGVWSTT